LDGAGARWKAGVDDASSDFGGRSQMRGECGDVLLDRGVLGHYASDSRMTGGASKVVSSR
jgi:hypothetical protein